MDRARIIRGIIISIFLGLLFYFLNQTQSTYSTTELFIRSVCVAVAFAVFYFLVFAILNNDTRKRMYGPPLSIGIILGVVIGQWLSSPFIGLAIGIVLGILIGAIRQRLLKE
ncbi:hypothetical protein [Staphylococcus cornubiensis]|uniref:hypothetical protein n=1 Tax=Staphylococcus cornubiensis TaxID=1986155 RepID=UPI000A3D18B5|nr:hypothetical protein [Staphylococcus cornubiensis]